MYLIPTKVSSYKIYDMMWMLPLYLHVNKKSDDDDEDESKGFTIFKGMDDGCATLRDYIWQQKDCLCWGFTTQSTHWVMSVYLNTFFLGRLSKPLTSTCVNSFARNWQLPFLNQWKGENDHRKYFMINLSKWMLPDPVGIGAATSWSPAGRASDWATKAGFLKKSRAWLACIYAVWSGSTLFAYVIRLFSIWNGSYTMQI